MVISGIIILMSNMEWIGRIGILKTKSGQICLCIKHSIYMSKINPEMQEEVG